MALIEAQAVRAVLLVILVAIVFTGVAFVGGAAFLALGPYMPPALAAAAVGIGFLAVALCVGFAVRGRARPARVEQATSAQNPDAAAMALLAGMAKEKPLMAVLFAGLMGAAGTILQHKNHVK